MNIQNNLKQIIRRCIYSQLLKESVGSVKNLPQLIELAKSKGMGQTIAPTNLKKNFQGSYPTQTTDNNRGVKSYIDTEGNAWYNIDNFWINQNDLLNIAQNVSL